MKTVTLSLGVNVLQSIDSIVKGSLNKISETTATKQKPSSSHSITRGIPALDPLEPNIQNCFHRFTKILKSPTPDQISLLGHKKSIHSSKPAHDFKIWEKIHTLTKYIDSVKNLKSFESKFSLRKIAFSGSNTNRDLKDAETKTVSTSKAFTEGVGTNGFSPVTVSTPNQNQMTHLTSFLNQNPLKVNSVNPKEFAEFYFVYKTDLEELYQYLQDSGIRMNNFTVENLKKVFENRLEQSKVDD